MVDLIVTILECGVIICWGLMVCATLAPSYDSPMSSADNQSKPKTSGEANTKPAEGIDG